MRVSIRNFIPVFAVLSALLVAGGPVAVANLYEEDFTTTTYQDGGATTALWDTSAGEIRLHPFALSVVGTADTPANAYGVAVAGDHAYVADGTGGLQIVDISDPTNPSVVGTGSTDFM